MMAHWQPINTAPRDGSEFLAWIPSGYHDVVFWHVLADHWTTGEDRVYPTHWMPLPRGPGV